MTEVVIHGASDDLIEIDGDIIEEFIANEDSGNVLAFSDGTLLEFTYTNQGIWRIAALARNTSTKYDKEEASDPESDNYSDRVTLNGFITWVVHGSGYAQAKVPVDA